MTDTVVLLVDDERTILESLRSQLDHLFGDTYEFETADCAAEAWELIEQLTEDGVKVVVVVSDWLMPGQRGDEFLLALRQRHPRIGRIMLTGHVNPDALARARGEAQVHQVLFKPWRPEELRDAITSAAGASS